jgi:hypothetical protein
VSWGKFDIGLMKRSHDADAAEVYIKRLREMSAAFRAAEEPPNDEDIAKTIILASRLSEETCR